MIPSDIEANLLYIELFTKKRIRNVLVGNYASVLKGHGFDFVEHKTYQAGDDIRKIDWNATARTGFPLVKNTHEERDVDVLIAADLSNSMNLASGTRSKKEVLLYITAALAYSALSDQVRIAFLGFTDRIEIDAAPTKGKSHLWTLLNRLWDFQPRRQQTQVLPLFELLRRRLKKMSIIFLISDFLFQDNIFEEFAFKHVVSRHDLIPIVLQDPLEAHLPAGHGYVRLQDLETGQQRWIRLSRENRLVYEESFRDRHRDLINKFYQYNLDFQQIQTDQSFHELISCLFLGRKRQ